MKIAALIVGIIGSLASFGLGSKWYTDFEKNKELIESLTQAASSVDTAQATAGMVSLNDMKGATYALLICGIVGLVASLLVFKQSKLAAITLVLAAIVPAFFSSMALVATFLLFIAGVLAFFVKSKTPKLA